MTVTELYILTWAILGMIAVAINVGVSAKGKIAIDSGCCC